MRGLKKIAKATQKINSQNQLTWVRLYYSIETKTAYTESGEGRYFVTCLINPQTEAEIRSTINAWLNM